MPDEIEPFHRDPDLEARESAMADIIRTLQDRHDVPSDFECRETWSDLLTLECMLEEFCERVQELVWSHKRNLNRYVAKYNAEREANQVGHDAQYRRGYRDAFEEMRKIQDGVEVDDDEDFPWTY